jgi:hypothetical protein
LQQTSESRKTSASFGKKKRRSSRDSLKNVDLERDTADEFNGKRESSPFKKIKDKKGVLDYLRNPLHLKETFEEGLISLPQSSRRLSRSRKREEQTYQNETRDFHQ